MDIVILVDTSCPMSRSECKSQQEQIADTLISLKGVDTSNYKPNSRVAYIEFSETDTTVYVELREGYYNGDSGDITQDMMDEYYNLIKSSGECKYSAFRTGDESNPPLYDAIDAAWDQFSDHSESSRDKKILIFSNCPVDQDEIERICDKWEII